VKYLLTLLLLSTAAHADTLGVHAVSWHDQPGYNNRNPGVYYATDDGIVIGAYRNSQRSNTVYAGKILERNLTENVAVSVTLGLATGYCTYTKRSEAVLSTNKRILGYRDVIERRERVVTPLIAPSIRLGGDYAVRITAIPSTRWTAGVIHASLEVRF